MQDQLPDYITALLGNQGGCIGEVSALALLIGAAYMLLRRIITWHIPGSYIGSVVLFSGILWLIDPSVNADPLFHLITGGMMLGVFYMATDYTSSPMSPRAQLVFGAGAGILTMLIRIWGRLSGGCLLRDPDHECLLSSAGPQPEAQTFRRSCKSLTLKKNGHGQTRVILYQYGGSPC
jgi:electron transport complex protein RnfD